jgi:hypothetical protein
MASIHNRKLIAVLTKGLKENEHEIQELRQKVTFLENKLADLYLIIKNKEQTKIQIQQHHQNQKAELNTEIVEEIIEE